MEAQEQVETLDSSEITVASLIQHMHSSSALFIWTVRNYSKLDNDILYYQTNDITKCTFKLMKTTHTLFVSMYNNSSRTYMKFYLLGLEDDVYAIGGKEIKECVYVGEFCSKMVSDKKKKFLVDDTINIHCVYFVNKCVGNITVVPYGQWRYKCCTDDLRDVLANLYATSHYHDFTIKAEDKTFKVHKAILVARSKYFSNLFVNGMTKNSTTLDVSADRLHDVLRYIYTGESKEWNVDEMIEIYEISSKLQIKCLSDKCEAFLRANLDVSNTLKFMNIACKSNSLGLRLAAVDYFANHLREFSESEEFEDTFKDVIYLLEKYPFVIPD